MPEATFLMSTWNAGPHIRPAVESVLAQTHEDWRMVVVDDGSSDGTPDVVESYGDPRIRLERMTQNAGQTAALNHGLGLVDTAWTARLDQDDVAAPARLERQLEWISAHPKTVAVGSWVGYIDDEGAPLGELRGASSPDDALHALYAEPERNPFAHSAMTFRTDLARQVGGYRSNFHYAQDTALWMDLAEHGELGNVPEFLTFIRQHAGQVSSSDSVAVKQLSEVLEATADAPRRLGLAPGDERAWRRARVNVATQLVLVALRDGDRAAARTHARAAATLCRRDPAALLDIAVVTARTVRYRASRLRRRD